MKSLKKLNNELYDKLKAVGPTEDLDLVAAAYEDIVEEFCRRAGCVFNPLNGFSRGALLLVLWRYVEFLQRDELAVYIADILKDRLSATFLATQDWQK